MISLRRSHLGRYDVFDPHDAKIAASQIIAQLKSGKVDQIEKRKSK